MEKIPKKQAEARNYCSISDQFLIQGQLNENEVGPDFALNNILNEKIQISLGEYMMIYPYSIFGILILILDIVAIVSVIGGRSSAERKVLWTVLILVLPVVGMILYYLIGKNSQDITAV